MLFAGADVVAVADIADDGNNNVNVNGAAIPRRMDSRTGSTRTRSC
jgi:hypothetical protein